MGDRPPPPARWPNQGALAWLRAQSSRPSNDTTTPSPSSSSAKPQRDGSSSSASSSSKPQRDGSSTSASSYTACLVCKLNVPSGSFAQHVSHQASHRERAASFVERQKRRCLALYSLMTLDEPLHKHAIPRLSTLLELLAQRRAAAHTTTDDAQSREQHEQHEQLVRSLYASVLAGQPVWCRFCETLVPNSDSLFVGYKLFEHYAGQRHEAKVAHFVSVYKQPPPLKRKLRFTKGSFDKYAERCEAFVPPPPAIGGAGAAAVMSHDAGLAMLDCAPMPMRQTASATSTSTSTSTSSSSSSHATAEIGVAALPPPSREVMPHAGPYDNRVASLVPPTEAAAPVLHSASGIVQCSTGWLDGRRVWGGGIIKVPQAAWVPWPIDLDHDDIGYQSAIMGSAPIASSFTGRKASASSSSTTPPSDDEQVGGFALGAVGAGLTSIGAHRFRPGEHNIHSTDAPAPWSTVSKEHDWSHVSDAVKAAVARSNATFGKPKKLMPKRLGAGGAAKPAVLPNFGGVWESGPRSHTRRAFLRPSSPS